jgi:predicted AAA+ superfamily ATPase
MEFNTIQRTRMISIKLHKGYDIHLSGAPSPLLEDLDHPKTVADYIAILESMDAAYVQSALREDKLSAAPKKARKVMFTDPFIYHALRAWIHPCKDPFNEQATKTLKDTEMSGKLVEACVVTHFRRRFPTYYIKGKGEVDIAYIDKEKFWPIEIKWTGQIRPKDLKQVVKYPNSRIWSRMPHFGNIQDIPSEPLPIGLFRLGI